jgi:hypothetical protein
MSDLILSIDPVSLIKNGYNFMHEYDIEVAPGVIYDDLISFNTEKFENKL